MSHHPYTSSAALISLMVTATWLLCSADVLSQVPLLVH